MRTLVTQRLSLEPLEARHAAAMFGGLSDVELYKFLADRPPESVEWLRERYQRLSKRQSDDGCERWWNWVLRLAGGELVGFVQATIVEEEAEIACVLFRPFWSQGLAREAMQAMIHELFESGVTSIGACAERNNERSRRLVEGLGFQERPLPEFRRDDAARDVWYVLDKTLPPPNVAID